VPLSDAAVAVLAATKRIASSQGYVFTASGGSAYSAFSHGKRALDARLQGLADWTLHDLRRSCASGLAALGVQPHIIEACLNHRSGVIRGLARTYNRHSYDGEKRAALEQWATHIEKNISLPLAVS
jgi:integrase